MRRHSFKIGDNIICDTQIDSRFVITAISPLYYIGIGFISGNNVIRYRDDVDAIFRLYKVFNYNIIWANLCITE